MADLRLEPELDQHLILVAPSPAPVGLKSTAPGGSNSTTRICNEKIVNLSSIKRRKKMIF